MEQIFNRETIGTVSELIDFLESLQSKGKGKYKVLESTTLFEIGITIDDKLKVLLFD